MCKCSFCGKEYDQTSLIEGKEGYICYECSLVVFECFDIFEEFQDVLNENETSEVDETVQSLPKIEISKPHVIKKQLDEYIIGQENAKKLLATEVYSHFRNLDNQEGRVKKNNICLIGPSGSGKTYLVESLAKILNVPFVVVDATSLSKTGYVGDSVNTIFERLYFAADENLELAQRGIVFIDEIDKLSNRFNASSSNKGDVGTIGVQQELLKVLEEANVEFHVMKKRTPTPVMFNTKNVLFVVGGAFVGLEEQKQKKSTKTIGFNSKNEDLDSKSLSHTTHEDLIEYKMMPELVGRLSVLIDLYALTEDEIIQVLTIAKDSVIESFKRRFATEGIRLKFEKETLRLLAKKVNKSKIGVRGVDGEIAFALNRLLYEELGKEVMTKEIFISPQHLRLQQHA